MPALPEHIPAISAHVREADRAELWAASCSAPADVLTRGLEFSTRCWTGTIDDVPVCMFGVAPATLLGETGRPWMVGTDHLDRHAVLFLRRNKGKVDEMLSLFPVLENYVDCRNSRAIQWLRWLKFSFGEPEPMGVYGLPFMRFERRRIS